MTCIRFMVKEQSVVWFEFMYFGGDLGKEDELRNPVN